MSRHGTRPASPRFLAAHGSAPHPRSGGAVIIIVLTLLSTMVFLGFFFFGFTDQASLAARSYAEADDSAGVIDPEAPTDLALEQLIVGTRSQYEESALWGGTHSMLSHVVGRIDGRLRPMMDNLHGGGGIQMVLADSDGNSTPDCYAMDYDGNGVADDVNGDGTLDHIAYNFNESDPPLNRNYSVAGGMTLNFSRVAQDQYREDAFDELNSSISASSPVPRNLNPAAGYTYPDLASLFLASDTEVELTDSSGGKRTVKVVIPSFFRPQLLLAERQGVSTTTNQMFEDPTNAVETLHSRMSLRPHERHRNLSSFPRFVRAATVAQSGDTSRLIQRFPFNVDRDKNGVANEFGVFTDPTRANYYEYDVDNDGDGVYDSIWMDLGLPMVELTDGRQVVPLVAFKVIDADGLFNVNAHGNLAGFYNPDVQSLALLFDRNGNGTYEAGDGMFPFHRSNMGLSPTEVNLAYGLTSALPAAVPLNEAMREAFFKKYYDAGISPLVIGTPSANGAFPRMGMGNADLLFLLTGRTSSGSGATLMGRHAEPELLEAFLAGAINTPPRAGYTFAGSTPANLADDDIDSQTAAGTGFDNSITTRPIPPGAHPLDLLGTGVGYVAYQPASTTNDTPNGAERRLTTSLYGATPVYAGNPSAWPTYEQSVSGRWYDNARTLPANTPVFGVYPYTDAAGGVLQTTAAASNDLIDEDNELQLVSTSTSPADSPFPPSENVGLQMSQRDFELSGELSKLKELAPYSLAESADSDRYRRMFTTDSWDRKEVGLSFNPNIRAWEYGQWLTSTMGAGPFVFDGVSFQETDLHFPPEFGPVGSKINIGSTTDPIRGSLRRLLWQRIRSPFNAANNFLDSPNFELQRTRAQQKLNLNRLLDYCDASGQPVYRQLTPHPTFANNENPTIDPMWHGLEQYNATLRVTQPNGGTFPGYGSIDAGTLPGRVAMEWWARFDRQRMARDLFTMLWLVGGGDDSLDYSQGVGDYTPARIREMAQFAVNVVDALDRDDVITQFEYDADLGDGWAGPYDVVYGIESQKLAFSEAMFINQPVNMMNLQRTLHEDNDSDHQFLFLELRNTSPFTVNLDNHTWRIVRVADGQPASTANIAAALEFQRNTSGAFKSIAPGENFVVACHDGHVQHPTHGPLPSVFYVDYTGSADFEAIVPWTNSAFSATSMTAPTPLVHLDATYANANHNEHVNITKAYDPGMANQGGVALVGRDALGVQPFDLVLQRRRNLGANFSSEIGAWVEVDRIKIQIRGNGELEKFEPTGDTQATMQTELQGGATATRARAVASFERPEPFYPGTVQRNDSQIGAINHSLIATTESTPHRANDVLKYVITQGATPSANTYATEHVLWEPHFNRDFSSVIELLSIPLYGYQGTSSSSTDTLLHDDPEGRDVVGGTTWNLAVAENMSAASDPTDPRVAWPRMRGHRTASVRLVNPEPALPTVLQNLQPAAVGHYRNRWFRVLGLLEVPDMAEQRTSLLANLVRIPGRINLNTIRHEAVLAGLIDDLTHLNPFANPDALTRDRLQSSRRWIADLLQARDGVDAILANQSAEAGFFPGSIESQPFRPLTYVKGAIDPASGVPMLTEIDKTVEHTILRQRPGNPGPLRHNLFEARTESDVYKGTTVTWGGVGDTGAADRVDYHTRNRLLAKIHNRTTTRSNVFFVWTTIGYFDAHQPPVAGTAGYVTIGAQAEDLPMRRTFSVVDMSRLEEAYDDPDPTDGTPGTFDFRKFVIYRKQIK